MARTLTAAFITELTAATMRPVVFVEAFFDVANPVRIWSGIGTRVWNGFEWTGVGDLLGISRISETADIRASGISISLSGIPSSFIALVLINARRGKAVTVYLGFLDSSGNVIANPATSFLGKMDVPAISEGPETSTVSIQVESDLISLDRAVGRRYTDEDQQHEFNGDFGFEFVEAVLELKLAWGGEGIPISVDISRAA